MPNGYDSASKSKRFKYTGRFVEVKPHMVKRVYAMPKHNAQLEELSSGKYIITRIKKSKRHIRIGNKDILVS